MVIGAISLTIAWTWRQLQVHRSSPSAPRSTEVSAAKAGADRLDRGASASKPAASSDGRRELTPREGSTLSQLREDFSRFPPKALAKRLWTKISEHEVTTLSTSFAYHWVFAIPPLLILVVMIAAIMNRATDVAVVENLRDLINERAPADSRKLLLDLVDNAVAKVGGGTASFGAIFTALLALWSGSNAVGILIVGFNRAYDADESRPFVRKKLLTLGLTLMLVVFVNLAFALLIFGEQLGSWVAEQFGLGSAFDLTWTIARWPLALAGIMLLLALLYWAGPNVKQPFRWISLGSVVATVLWLILVAGFGLYLSLSNPGSAYGVVGSVIVLLVFLNFTGIIFFLGAEVGALLARAADEDVHEAPAA
jgi:membrane protein